MIWSSPPETLRPPLARGFSIFPNTTLGVLRFESASLPPRTMALYATTRTVPRLLRARCAGDHRGERAKLHFVLLCSLWTTGKTYQQRRRVDSIQPPCLSPHQQRPVLALPWVQFTVAVTGDVGASFQMSSFCPRVNIGAFRRGIALTQSTLR
jgi:hypothetical protein